MTVSPGESRARVCGWVPSAGQVSLSVSVGWGDTTFYATSMCRIRVCRAGSASGRSTSSTWTEATGGAPPGEGPASPGSRGRAGVSTPPPASTAAPGSRLGLGGPRVADTAPTTLSSGVGVVKAGTADVPGVVPQSRGLPQKEGSNGRLSRSRDTRYGTRGPGSRAGRNAKTSRHGLLAGDDGASHRRRPSS